MNFLDWLGVTRSRTPLSVGDAVPDVTSRDQHGIPVRLADFTRTGITLIYFYPKADTPGCTAQACSLRDDFARLLEKGIRILGVSADSPEAQRKFMEKRRLPFTLLADEDRAVISAFGVPMLLGMPLRQAFLMKDGFIVWRDLKASTTDQARDVIAALNGLITHN